MLRTEPPSSSFPVTGICSAMGGCIALQEAGLSIPEDISVMGYDGIYLSRVMKPQLVLVVVVLVGVDGPLDNGAIFQGGGGFVLRDGGDLGVIVIEAALELVVPAPRILSAWTAASAAPPGRRPPVCSHTAAALPRRCWAPMTPPKCRPTCPIGINSTM